jgi:hypothetical protein
MGQVSPLSVAERLSAEPAGSGLWRRDRSKIEAPMGVELTFLRQKASALKFACAIKAKRQLMHQDNVHAMFLPMDNAALDENLISSHYFKHISNVVSRSEARAPVWLGRAPGRSCAWRQIPSFSGIGGRRAASMQKRRFVARFGADAVVLSL